MKNPGLPCLGLLAARSVWQQQEGGWDWKPGAPSLTGAAASRPSSAVDKRKNNIGGFFAVVVLNWDTKSAAVDLIYSIWQRGQRPWTISVLTFGAVVWKLMLVTGAGADESMEIITTRTSGRDGGESRAKWKRTRRLWLSNTVTGNRLPAERQDTKEISSSYTQNTQNQTTSLV